MPAVSDSSPLILYARIGQLGLLHALFDEVVVPPAVWWEVVTEGAGRYGATELPRSAWIRLVPLPPTGLLSSVRLLDRGEAEAITLSVALSLDGPVILDDRRARRIALDLGLRVVGSAGLLNLAKQVGVTPTVRPLLDELRAAGLYLSDAAADRFLDAAGER